MYKLSYYTIFSDLLNSKGDSVLFCTRSSQAFVINNNIRERLERESFDELEPEVLNALIESCGIVKIEEDELNVIRTENQNFITDNNVKHLYTVIQPSANCQLGCYYCGQSHTKKNLSSADSSLIVDRIRKKISGSQDKYESIYVGWFGAEPLMGLPQMRELTTEFKSLAEEFGIKYSSKVVTNGLSLKPQIYRELAEELNVRSIEVTLDGTADYHDGHRYTKNGGSSFDLIYKNLLEIFSLPDYKEINCAISIRCNVDKRNWSDVSNLINKISNDNFQDKISHFYPIGIYSWAKNDAHDNALTKEEFAEKEIDWLIELIQAGFKVNLLPARQKQVCAAVDPGFEMYDAFGNIFNCTEVSYSSAYENTPYILGNLKKPEEVSQVKPLVDWNEESVITKFPCGTCKMLPVCGGSCPKSWHEDMRACPTSKFNIKQKLALAYINHKTNIRELI
ncbi:MAG: radical SAM protein [Flavobacterium sp.]|jgi:uncharacterized protein|uniref:radical SAM/SPASM domain-containing protein n=1 Tax=Flavobacterium sp. TaxID=239 RepID=UPI0022BFA0A8|nr:radical SAM protein [Flavobacterium sp.]MCZ8023863.1 radical SAM protein [Cytophagales bacterium]MCZ8332581.1 radical SAM protein [Flavobacterium sp.]